MTLTAADERAHAPGADRWWWDTWHLDVASDDGIGLAVRLACAPVLGVAWWWTHLVLPDRPGPIVVRDHEVLLPRQGLAVRADGLWGELDCETPFEHWTYGLEAFGVALDDPAESLRGEIGERIAVGLDIEWDVDLAAGRPIDPHEFDRGGEHGYEQFGSVHGEVLLGRERFEIDAVGLRSHAWGSPWFDRPVVSSWWRSPDGATSFWQSGSDGADVGGYALDASGAAGAITAARSETQRRADGLPRGARLVIDDRDEIDVEVAGLVAIPLVGDDGASAVLARGLCRYPGLGSHAIGWSSWLDPAAA